MEPRLKSSRKWTAFPKEYADQIRTVFLENFAEQLKGGDLKIEGRIYPSEVLLRVEFAEKGRLAHANFEVSADYSPEKADAVSRIHNCVDAAASMMTEFFETEGEVDFPFAWKPFPFQGQNLFLRYSTTNSDLDAEADRLLGVTAESLVQEIDDEDALGLAETDEELSGGQDLAKETFGTPGEDDPAEQDDEGEEGGPRMFGGGTTKKAAGPAKAKSATTTKKKGPAVH